MALFNKFAAAMSAGIVFCVILSAIDYTPPDQRLENVLYYSYADLLIMGMFYVVPFFLFLGMPASILLDSFLSRMRTGSKARNYGLSVLFYALGGAVVTLLLLLLLQGGRADSLPAFFRVLLAVVFASLLLLHFSILFDSMFRKSPKGTR